MPTYDYVCKACGARHEIFQSMSESAKRKCPACGKLALERQIGAGAGFIFKGAGFYETDYRSDSYKQGAKSEESASKDDGGGSSKGDASKKGSSSAGSKGDASSD